MVIRGKNFIYEQEEKQTNILTHISVTYIHIHRCLGVQGLPASPVKKNCHEKRSR